jgi:CubicO group peptidase (beta-lactamase class C family)
VPFSKYRMKPMNTQTTLLLPRQLLTMAIAMAVTAFSSKSDAAEEAIDKQQQFTLPVRVFLMESEVSEKIDCQLTEADVKEIFAVANETWAPAKIKWTIESVRELTADPKLAEEYENAATGRDNRGSSMKTLTRTYSSAEFLKPGFNVVIVRKLTAAGGVFRPQTGEIVYAASSPTGEIRPVILAHEFGHSLSLPHTVFEANNNLMMTAGPSRKPTRTKPLTKSQIALARAQAATGNPFRPQRLQPPAPASKLFAFLDRDGDGKITVAENLEKHQAFVRHTLRLASRAPHDSLTKDEYDLVKLRSQKSRPTSGNRRRVAPSVTDVFAKADKNEDGKLSEQEAKGHVPPRNFKMSDRNQDGFVTPEEMIAARKRFGIDAEGFKGGKPKAEKPKSAKSNESGKPEEDPLKAKFANVMEKIKLHGSIAVARNGKILFTHADRMADHRKSLPNSPTTRHRIGSITKPFTAMAILMLEEQGKLKTEDTVGQHLPDVPQSWQPLTLHQLLTHTSGLTHSWGLPAFKKSARERLSLQDTLRLFHDEPLRFKPGSDFGYSGVGYFLLARIIEERSGQSYETFMKEQIFDPLQMHATGAGDPEAPRSVGYGRTPNGRMSIMPEFPMTMLTGGGNLYSTVEDLILWDAALRAGKLLSAAGYEKFYRTEKEGYAYGWHVKTEADRTALSHGGAVPGFTAYLLRYPEEGICVAVLTNTRSSGFRQLAQELADSAIPEKTIEASAFVNACRIVH